MFLQTPIRPMDVFPHTRHFAPMGAKCLAWGPHDLPNDVSPMDMGRNMQRPFTSKTWRWKVRWSNFGLSTMLALCPRPSSSAAACISMAHLCDSADIMDIIRNCFKHVELTVDSLLYFNETNHGYDLEIYVRPFYQTVLSAHALSLGLPSGEFKTWNATT